MSRSSRISASYSPHSRSATPWKAVQRKKEGDEFTVFGVLRVNMNAISAFIKAAGGAAAARKLPYGMIVVVVK